MYVWILYICILAFVIHLGYQYLFVSSPSFKVRRMKYIMDSLEPFDTLEPEVEYGFNTELLEYKWTSIINMIGHGLEQMDEYYKKIVDGIYNDYLHKFFNFYMR